MSEPHLRAANVKPKRGVSVVWLLPLIALAIALWLLYKNISEAGLEITVAFENGSGISAGKTPVVYQGINVGRVSALKLDDDLSGVTATLELDTQITPLIREKTEFWLVKPQISLSGVSGLDTLVAGNYISFKPGDGKEAQRFTALPEPPPFANNAPGLKLILEADQLGSISLGAPVLYQQIDVGDVEGYQLREKGVEINLRLDPQYRHLVNASSRFWNQSGVKVRAGLQGINLDAGSMASIIAGGIAFDTPEKDAAPVDSGSHFKLHATRALARGSSLVNVHFHRPDGVQAGTKVRMAGIEVGEVDSVKFTENDPTQGVDAKIRITSPNQRYLNSETRFWLVTPEISTSGISGLDTLVGGPYVAMKVDGQPGQALALYTALNEPPKTRIQAPGLRLKLEAEELHSVREGTKIYYRKIAVGQVETVSLHPDGVELGIFIHQRYQHLVRRESQFWNASGFSVSGGLGGLEIQAESVSSIVAGGIAFHTPEVAKPQAAWEGLKYTLFPNFESTYAEEGQNIEIRFASGNSVNKGTELKYQGIKVGEVSAVELSSDMGGVIVKAHLVPSAKALAKEGSQFWVVKPQLGLVGTRNLETLVTGSYISVRPGEGSTQKRFIGLDVPPPLEKPAKGLNLVLSAPQRGSIKEGVKVFYRDIPVGEVFAFELAPDATQTLIHINILPRFVPLIRSTTRFWNSSGVAVKFGLFSGTTIRSKSVESLLEGGIALATPETDADGALVAPGSQFKLHDSVEPEWLQWAPKIPIDDRPK
ncbi:MlaD family protein [Spongiibacter taiwanensis]|uniref:PqiB family protein n=1 Tax=Spongiibacter taiwanensis TaxID=1748242 RepID=UPI0020361478|nr:MlaD family protein [Spongiibacter taiwanensis]USA44118.1 MlaD family protein [Spongiibacter taiwanensis]